jgi:hypothetical protein
MDIPQSSLPCELQVQHDGQPLRLRVERCTITLGGEFAGNVDLVVSTEPSSVAVVLRALTLYLELDEDPESLELLGHREDPPGRIDATYTLANLRSFSEAPGHVALRFAGKEIARIPCPVTGSVAAEGLPFREPTQLVPQLGPPKPREEAPIERAWLGPILAVIGSCMLAVGVGLAWHHIEKIGFEPGPDLVIGMMLSLLGCFALLFLWVPVRRVRVDVLRGQVVVLEGRRGLTGRIKGEPQRLSTSSFSHVRIIERFEDLEDERRALWCVYLEPEIAWIGEAGDMQLQPGALQLEDFTSQESAHRYAAEIGSALGMRILEGD